MLPRLPDTRDELVSIAESLGVDPAGSVFVGLDATEKNVKSLDLSATRVVAFATHGLASGDLNGLSEPALALTSPEVSGEEDSDGLLSMSEILGLDLNADWVVLSACNTAAADGSGAEAVSGLGRAFFYAGARSLLVSHWPVHSQSTTELMTTLFRAHASEPDLDRAEALRRARIHLIDEVAFQDSDGSPLFSYAHPIFWAPFTIVGDGGSSATAVPALN
jgi:CHAT domain-containing protein